MVEGWLEVFARQPREPSAGGAATGDAGSTWELDAQAMAAFHVHHHARLYAYRADALALLPHVLSSDCLALRYHNGAMGGFLEAGNAKPLLSVSACGNG